MKSRHRPSWAGSVAPAASAPPAKKRVQANGLDTASPPPPSKRDTSGNAAGFRPSSASAVDDLLKDQHERRAAANKRPFLRKMLDRTKGIASISSTEAPPALQAGGGHWSPQAAKEIVQILLWEKQRHAPQQADPVELARAVACVERARALADACKTPATWRKARAAQKKAAEDAMTAWLKAFSLDQAFDLAAVRNGYANGGTGYEHKGKSIMAGIAGSVASSASTVDPLVLIARTMFSGAQVYFEGQSGEERLRRKPNENLAALLNINPPDGSNAPLGMPAAVKLSSQLHAAQLAARKLGAALESGSAKDIARYLEEAEKLIDTERLVKARLNLSAEEWAGRKRELPVRGTANLLLVAGTMSSIWLHFGLLYMPVMIGGSAGMHASFRLTGWDKKDTRDRSMMHFYNYIKSYSWIDEKKMPAARIAALYEDFEDGKISRNALRNELKQSGAFDLAKASASMQLPAEQRMRAADTLLRGRLAEVLGARPERLADRRLKQFHLSQGLADLCNFQYASQKIADATRFDGENKPALRDKALNAAAEFLHAVCNEEVRQLFTGDMRAQSAAGAEALRRRKGVAEKYRAGLAVSSMPTMLAGPIYGEVTDAVKIGMADEGMVQDQHVKTGVAGGGAATLAMPALSVNVLNGSAYQRHAPKPGQNSDAGSAARPGTASIALRRGEGPVQRSDLRRVAVSELAKLERVPDRIVIEQVRDGARVSISADFADIEAHEVDANRASGTRLSRYRKLFVAGLAAAGESAREPFLRQAVTRRMRETRKARRKLHELVDRHYVMRSAEEGQRQARAGDARFDAGPNIARAGKQTKV